MARARSAHPWLAISISAEISARLKHNRSLVFGQGHTALKTDKTAILKNCREVNL
jgi:hypothetical protein